MHTSTNGNSNDSNPVAESVPTFGQIFCDCSSIRGVQKIRRAQSKSLSALWLGFVLGMTLVLVVTSGFLVAGYLNYDTAWHTSTALDYPTDFPAITLCSHNPFAERATEIWKSHGILSPREYKLKLVNFTSRAVLHGHHDLVDFFMRDDVQSYYSYLDFNSTVTLGHKRNFLFFCLVETSDYGTYIFNDCKVEDNTNLIVKHFSHSKYFNCWTVDSGEGKATANILSITFLIKLTPTGSIPQLQRAFITDLLKRGEGVKVVLHERNTFPDVSRNAVNVQPGKMNQIRYDPVKWNRYNSPNKPCADHQPPIMDLGQHFHYTFAQCLDSAVQLENIRQCQCMNSEMPGRLEPRELKYCFTEMLHLLEEDRDVSHLKNCLFNMSTYEKFIKAKAQFSQCLPRCSEFTYNKELSVSKWVASNISLHNLMSVYASVSELTNNSLSGQEIEEHLQNLLKVHTIPPDEDLLKDELMNEETYTYVSLERKHDDATLKFEKLTLDIYVLLSRVGGLCSLCIGLTTAFFVELVEFIYLSVSAFKQKRKQQTDNKRVQLEIKQSSHRRPGSPSSSRTQAGNYHHELRRSSLTPLQHRRHSNDSGTVSRRQVGSVSSATYEQALDETVTQPVPDNSSSGQVTLMTHSPLSSYYEHCPVESPISLV